MHAASLSSIDCVEQIVKEGSIDCNFARWGHLEVACKQSHFNIYARPVDLIAREFNHHPRIVQKANLETKIGSRFHFGGLVDESSAECYKRLHCTHRARSALCRKYFYRHQRVYRFADTQSATPNHTDRFIHHRDLTSSGSAGARTDSAQSHDLRLQVLSALLPAYSRQSNAVWRSRRILPGNGKHYTQECGDLTA